MRCLPDKKNFCKVSRSRFCADCAQNLPGTAPNNILEFPKFHPNPFTSGGVIAERVNIVETCHKVFPILGEASSLSNKVCYHRGTMQHVMSVEILSTAAQLHNKIAFQKACARPLKSLKFIENSAIWECHISLPRSGL